MSGDGVGAVEQPSHRGARRVTVIAIAACLLAAAGLWPFVTRSHGDNRVAVTVTFQHCANPDYLEADGSAWESSSLGLSAWGGDEPGHLEISGNLGTFRSDLDGQTIVFQRVRFSTMTCRIGRRP